MAKRLAVAAVAWLCLSVHADPAEASKGLKGFDWFQDPLLYGHLIVRGVVTAVDRETIREGDWAPVPTEWADREMTVIRVEFAVTEVLKGQHDGDHVSIRMYMQRDLLHAFRENEKQILCLRMNKLFPGGAYTIWNSKSVFTLIDGKWIRRYDSKGFELNQLRRLLEEQSVERVIEKSDVIVIGRITAERSERLAEDPTMPVTVYSLEIEAMIKGEVEGGTIEFVTRRRLPTHAWIPYTPRRINVDEHWYCFLKKRGSIYYVFAGANGLFRIDGQNLVYDNSVEHPLHKSQLDKMVPKAR